MTMPTQPTTQALNDAIAQQQAEVQGGPKLPDFLGQQPQPPQVAPVAPQAVPQPAPPQQPVPPQAVQQPAQPQQPVASVPVAATQQPPAIAVTALAVPEWLAVASKDMPTGLEEIAQQVVPPRLMVRQGLTDNTELLARPDIVVGDLYLSGDLRKLYSVQEKNSLKVTVVHFYQEWALENPRGLKPRRVQSTRDPQSLIAQNAMNSERWQGKQVGVNAKNEPQYQSYVGYMRFLCVLWIDNAPVVPIEIAFSKTGIAHARNWCTLITARSRGSNVPVYAGVYELYTELQTNSSGTWPTLKAQNCHAAPWVAEADLVGLKALHEDLVKADKAGRLSSSDMEDDRQDDEPQPQANGGYQETNYGPPAGWAPQQPGGWQQAPPNGWQQPGHPQQGDWLHRLLRPAQQPGGQQPPQQQPYVINAQPVQPQQPQYGHAQQQPQQAGDPNAALQQAAAQRGGYPGGGL